LLGASHRRDFDQFVFDHQAFNGFHDDFSTTLTLPCCRLLFVPDLPHEVLPPLDFAVVPAALIRKPAGCGESV
jgi:hypothetical protein